MAATAPRITFTPRETGWRRVPECAWLDATTADADRWAEPRVLREVRVPRAASASDSTSSISFPGPVFVAPQASDSGPPRGELVVSGELDRVSLPVGKEAAR